MLTRTIVARVRTVSVYYPLISGISSISQTFTDDCFIEKYEFKEMILDTHWIIFKGLQGKYSLLYKNINQCPIHHFHVWLGD